MSGFVYMMSDKPRGVIYERIDEIENVYRPHPNTDGWGDYK